MTFNELHQATQPLLLCNVWDATSARIAEQSGFQAIGTSSAAIAAMLGKADGEQVPFTELLFFVKIMLGATKLPLTVDIESGYADSVDALVDNLVKLHDLGVVGVNIEDSEVIFDKQGIGKRTLVDSREFANSLREIKNELTHKGISLFINVRTDAFLTNIEGALQKTIKRTTQYESAGADGIFAPCITTVDDIRGLVNSTELPVNAMCMPDLPNFIQLAELGIKRISMGNFVHGSMLTYMSSVLAQIKRENSFKVLF